MGIIGTPYSIRVVVGHCAGILFFIRTAAWSFRAGGGRRGGREVSLGVSGGRRRFRGDCGDARRRKRRDEVPRSASDIVADHRGFDVHRFHSDIVRLARCDFTKIVGQTDCCGDGRLDAVAGCWRRRRVHRLPGDWANDDSPLRRAGPLRLVTVASWRDIGQGVEKDCNAGGILASLW